MGFGLVAKAREIRDDIEIEFLGEGNPIRSCRTLGGILDDTKFA